MTTFVAVVCGAAGAGARFGLGSWVQRRSDASDVPVGTAVVNLVGCLALGVVVGLEPTELVMAALAGGLAGFTTYSTWMIETVSLTTEGREGWVRAAVNLFGLVAAGLALGWVGLEIGRAFV